MLVPSPFYVPWQEFHSRITHLSRRFSYRCRISTRNVLPQSGSVCFSKRGRGRASGARDVGRQFSSLFSARPSTPSSPFLPSETSQAENTPTRAAREGPEMAIRIGLHSLFDLWKLNNNKSPHLVIVKGAVGGLQLPPIHQPRGGILCAEKGKAHFGFL